MARANAAAGHRLARGLGGLASLRVLLLFSGCIHSSIVDDQRIASAEDRAVVDPAPEPRDFRGQNERHKVLVAVLDTGVDYNHPLLLQNIHFSLDACGRPIGLGRDLVGDDDWPAPYLARTARYDTRLDAATRAESMRAWEKAKAMVKAAPDLARFFHPSRDVAAEHGASVSHGTHVAGLMVYDRPDIGLLAYRVLPHNRFIPKDKETATHEYDADIAERIGLAVEAAAAAGARVVNMSLGGDTDVDKTERHRKIVTWSEQLRKIVIRYPRVLFVLAAGNAGRWLDGASRISYPCGVRASNVLCVGALRADGDPTTFTNIPISGVDVAFALGEKVLSTVPTGICADLVRKGGSKKRDLHLAEEARKQCASTWHLERMSGTSMAAPLASHLAAEILAEMPELPAADVIRELQRRSDHTFIGDHPVYKIRFQKPTWYALQERAKDDEVAGDGEDPGDGDGLDADGAAVEPDTWEAYLPIPGEHQD